MGVINEVNHKILGNIYCITDKNGNPWQWMKDKNLKIFSNEIKKIAVKLDFYCFNRYFKYDEFRRETAEETEKGICESYQEFLKDINNIEGEFYKEFETRELDDLLNTNLDSENINKIEDLYRYLEVKEVRIYNGGYSIIMSTKWSKKDIGIERWDIFSENSWYNVNFECNIEPIKMDYYD